MGRTKIICAVSGILIAMLLMLCQPAESAQELIPFITPPPGGGAYIVGAGVVTVTNRYIKETQMIHEAATGAMDIVRRMQQKEAAKKPAFGRFGNIDAWNAYNGNNEYKGRPFTGIRTVVSLGGTDLYFAVPTNSPIKSFADARGKRIGMGGAGSTVAHTAHFLFEQYGVTKKDFKPYYYTYKETVEGIQDGSLDGGFIAGGYPISAYSELSTMRSVRIVPVDENLLKKILPEHPYYYRNVVKAKSYKGLDQDTTIMGWGSSLWTHAGVSSEYVYKFIKNLIDHREEFYAIHPAAREMSPETALQGLTIPLHPGAEKYYRDTGILKK